MGRSVERRRRVVGLDGLELAVNTWGSVGRYGLIAWYSPVKCSTSDDKYVHGVYPVLSY